MKCETYETLLSPYLDKELTKEEQETLEAHLKVCSHCQEELEILKEMLGYLHTLKEVELPKHFHKELMKKVAAEGTTDKVKMTTHKERKRKYNKVISYISSVAALFIVGIVWVYTDRLPSNVVNEPIIAATDSGAVGDLATQKLAVDDELATTSESEGVNESMVAGEPAANKSSLAANEPAVVNEPAPVNEPAANAPAPVSGPDTANAPASVRGPDAVNAPAPVSGLDAVNGLAVASAPMQGRRAMPVQEEWSIITTDIQKIEEAITTLIKKEQVTIIEQDNTLDMMLYDVADKKVIIEALEALGDIIITFDKQEVDTNLVHIFITQKE